MNQTSPAATGTAGAVIAALVAIIAMVNTRLKLGLSPQDQVSIAGGIVVAAHWIALQVAALAAGSRISESAIRTFIPAQPDASTKLVLTGDGGGGGCALPPAAQP